MSDRSMIAAGVAALLVLGPLAAQGQDWRTTSIMRQTTSEESLEVELGYGAGTLSIEPAEGRMLYQASLRYNADGFEPIADYANGRLRLGIDTHNKLRLGDHEHDDHDGGRMSLRLGRGVPLDLDFEFGAALADIELGGLSIRRLELSTGASETRVRFSQPNPIPMETLSIDVGAADFAMRGLGNSNAREIRLNGGVAEMELEFSGEWRSNMRLEADFGLGSLTLRVPRNIGVRVRKDTLLTSFEAPRMSRRGDDEYYSDNWSEATRRLTIDIDAAFGDITIDWID